MASRARRQRSLAANLITTVWRGREKLHYLNAVPINAIAERWIDQYDRERARALKLTVLHGGFDPGSAVLDGISQGWPVILASLKTLLETGDPLPTPSTPTGRAG